MSGLGVLRMGHSERRCASPNDWYGNNGTTITDIDQSATVAVLPP